MKKLECERCSGPIPLVELDGELLCETCATAWVQGQAPVQDDQP